MFLSTPTTAHSGLIKGIKNVWNFKKYNLAWIKLICRTWWILKDKVDRISLNLSSSSVTTPSYSFFRSGESKYWFLLFNSLKQLDRGGSCDDPGWRGHHHGEHCRKTLQIHTVPCLDNAGSWLGCLWPRSNLQSPLLCSASFSGLSVVKLLFLFSFLFQVNVTNIQEKLVVAVVGFEINLVNCSVTG